MKKLTVVGNGESVVYDLMKPHILLKDLAISSECKDAAKSFEPPMSDTMPTPDTGLEVYARQLLERSIQKSPDVLLSPSEVQHRTYTGIDRADEAPTGPVIGSLLSGRELHTRKPAQGTNAFHIHKGPSHIAIINLTRSVFCLGEMVSASVSFGVGHSRSFSLKASLETEELISPSVALRSSTSVRRATRRIHAYSSSQTLNLQRVVCNLIIPPAATPSFHTSGIQLEWKLRFHFVTMGGNAQEESLLETVMEDDRGALQSALQEIDSESFEVNIPLQVFGTGNFLPPSKVEQDV